VELGFLVAFCGFGAPEEMQAAMTKFLMPFIVSPFVGQHLKTS
jgi:hypothetical protein